MVASIPYVRAVEPHHLDTYTPEVSKAYITSRMESARVIVRDGLEDPFDDFAMVQQQLDQFSVIVRCEYEKTCNFVINTFDQVIMNCIFVEIFFSWSLTFCCCSIDGWSIPRVTSKPS